MMTEGIEPMTAAEYRSEVGVPRTILGERLLAALSLPTPAPEATNDGE